MNLAELEITPNKLDKINARLSKRHVALDEVASVGSPSDVVWAMLRLQRWIFVSDVEA